MVVHEQQNSPFMTVVEISEYMRVSKMTVYRLIHSGELPATQITRSFRVRKTDVDAYLRGADNYDD